MSEVDNIELKKRARRRLVGAAALALLAAIVLPMVMDEDPGDLRNHDIQIVMPDRNASETLTPSVEGHPVEPTEEMSASVQQPAASPQVSAVPGEVPPLIPEPTPDPAPPKPPAAQPAAASPPPASPPKGSGETEEARRVQAILDGTATTAVASAASNGTQRYFVQVGAFGDANKAATLSGNLKTQGFQAFFEQAGAVTRVKIGPFSNRQEADRAIAKLKSLGMDGVITSR